MSPCQQPATPSNLAVSLELAEAIGVTISPPFLDDRAVQGFTSDL
jgi:hypothetical protein